MARPKSPFRLWKREGVFYYRLPNGGGWKSTGCHTKTDALGVVLKVLKHAPVPVMPRSKPKGRQTLKEYLAPYYTDRCPHTTRLATEGKGVSPVYLKSLRSMLERKVFGDAICALRMDELRRGDLVDFRDRLRATTGGRTTNVVMQALKTAFAEGVYREELPANPAAGIGRVRYEQKKVGTFTLDEVGKMFREAPGPWADEETHALFLTTYSLGLRRNEALGLRWGSVDFEKNVVSIHEAVDDLGRLKAPKWNKNRTVPLPAVTAATLKAQRARSVYVLPDAFVFCDVDGKPHRPGWTYERFKRAMKALKIDTKARGLRIHSFRHSSMSHLAASGYSFELARAAFGWGDAATQAGYVHLGGADLAGQATLMDGFLKK